jgi:hypothetical protein
MVLPEWFMTFVILIAVTLRIMTLWDVTQCVLVESLADLYLHMLG